MCPFENTGYDYCLKVKQSYSNRIKKTIILISMQAIDKHFGPIYNAVCRHIGSKEHWETVFLWKKQDAACNRH